MTSVTATTYSQRHQTLSLIQPVALPCSTPPRPGLAQPYLRSGFAKSKQTRVPLWAVVLKFDPVFFVHVKCADLQCCGRRMKVHVANDSHSQYMFQIYTLFAEAPVAPVASAYISSAIGVLSDHLVVWRCLPPPP